MLSHSLKRISSLEYICKAAILRCFTPLVSHLQMVQINKGTPISGVCIKEAKVKESAVS
jgi:hypothetical protein